MAFFSDITDDKYNQIMEYLKDGTPLSQLLLKSDNQMHSCFLTISAMRSKSGLEHIPNPFDNSIVTSHEINQTLHNLEQYDESDYDNILNICLTIWYLAKLKKYKMGIDIIQNMYEINVLEMEKLAMERINTKLEVFNEY